MLVFPTASADHDEYTLVRLYVSRRVPRVTTLMTFLGLPRTSARSSSADAILRRGGNTREYARVWRVHGIYELMPGVGERVVLWGASAGMICWFESGVTDSFGPAARGDGLLGFLPGSACPPCEARSSGGRLSRAGLERLAAVIRRRRRCPSSTLRARAAEIVTGRPGHCGRPRHRHLRRAARDARARLTSLAEAVLTRRSWARSGPERAMDSRRLLSPSAVNERWTPPVVALRRSVDETVDLGAAVTARFTALWSAIRVVTIVDGGDASLSPRYLQQHQCWRGVIPQARDTSSLRRRSAELGPNAPPPDTSRPFADSASGGLRTTGR